MKMNPAKFKFDNKRKTDMAVYAANPYSSFEREQVSYEDILWKKYMPYGGLWIYSKSTKAKINQTGKNLFGTSFKVALPKNNTNIYSDDHSLYFFPISDDKKYIVDNNSDWGDWCSEHKYLSVKKKNGIYIVKAKYTYGYWEEPVKELYSNTYTIKLKKKGWFIYH